MLPMRHVVAALMLVTAGLLSAGVGQTDMQDIPFTNLARGHHSGIHDARHVVIRDQAAWQTFLADFKPLPQSARQLQEVDFNAYMVVGIFLGMRHSGGYQVVINRIVRDPNDNTISVQATETLPLAGTFTIQVITYPYHLVRIPASSDAVKFLLAVP